MFFSRRAFTLIELLVIIAIIAVLAAIIFPVYFRARLNAYKNADVSNMNALRGALQLYHADQGGYPPALLGYVTPYMEGPVDMTNMVPADQVRGALYPRRVDSLERLKPIMLRATVTEVVNAVWPSQDPRAIGSSPILDLDGSGTIDTADDLPDARQMYGPADGFVRVDRSQVTNDQNQAANFYKISGYDVATVPDGLGGMRTELRYTPFWTVWGLTGGHANDDPRQLGYADPPENTVVTWNSSFREYEDNQLLRRRLDLVLFLGGGTRHYDSKDVSERSWRVLP